MEWRSSSSQAKLLGTMTCIAGAFIVTFYKGPSILSSISPSSLPVTPHSKVLGSAGTDCILGGFFLAGEALMISLYYIVQVKVKLWSNHPTAGKKFPKDPWALYNRVVKATRKRLRCPNSLLVCCGLDGLACFCLKLIED